MSEDDEAIAFPVQGIMPKEDTGALRFLRKNPQYDGRGTLIAIFDTGVDPGAPGLQVTSDGKPKIVAMLDVTGSGDVDTSTVVSPNENNEIVGLSGRTLKLGAHWKNPSGKYHIGIKKAFSLFPTALVNRLKRERKKKHSELQRRLEADLRRKLLVADSKTKENLEAKMSELQTMDKNFNDPGPIFDCIVFNDGQNWRCAIDKVGDGNLQNAKLMTDFSIEKEYDTFSGEDLMNYTVNILNDGNLLSIVGQAGAHATHVAGITGAFFQGQPELSGAAPGCQLISVKIGDNRLDGMETGTSLIRALIVARKFNVDLINLSYGEPTSVPNRGRWVNLVKSIVSKYTHDTGIIFVSSAGNAGPALTTVGSGATTGAIISVGAYVSPSMMKAEYSMRKNIPENQYTWSSRGPTADGALGVNISACGGAISPVPSWSLKWNQLQNGTSMASPCACGNIALIISALKQQNIKYSPYRIRRAVENTARIVPNISRLGQGCGLLSTDKAYQYLTKFRFNHDEQDILFQVTYGRNKNRGIYLRESYQCCKPSDFNITIAPQFFEPENTDDVKQNHSISCTTTTTTTTIITPSVVSNTCVQIEKRNRRKATFNLRMVLSCEADWVELPTHTLLMNGGRTVTINVDPTGLDPGVHFTELLGMNSEQPESGALFRFPITVIICYPVQQPILIEKIATTAATLTTTTTIAKSITTTEKETTVTSTPSSTTNATMTTTNNSIVVSPPLNPTTGERQYRFDNLAFEPGHIERRFISIPEHATWADFIITGHEIDTARLFVLHCVYLQQQTRFRDTQLNKYKTFHDGDQAVFSMGVLAGATLEVCLAQFWSSLGKCLMNIEVVFHSLVPSKQELLYDPSQGVMRIDVRCFLGAETFCPSGSLKKLLQSVTSHESNIRPLNARDQLPQEKQIYEMILSFNWEAKEKCKVTPRVPLLNGTLYDAAYGSQLWMLFDSNKQLIGSGDSWPDPVSVSKGKYTLRLQVRHDHISMLEKLQDMTIVFEINLAQSISFNLYSSYLDAITGGKKITSCLISKGQTRVVFVTPLSTNNFPKYAQPGNILMGNITYGKSENRLGSGKRPEGFPFRYVIPPNPPRVFQRVSPKSSSKGNSTPSLPKSTSNGEITATGKVSKEEQKVAADADKSKENDTDSAIENDIRDMTVKYLQKLANECKGEKNRSKGKKAFEKTELIKNQEEHLPYLMAKVTYFNNINDPPTRNGVESVLVICEKVIKKLQNGDLLAQHYGKFHNSEFDVNESNDEQGSSNKVQRKMEEQKKQLISILYTKANTLMNFIKFANNEKDLTKDKNRFSAAMKELSSWVDFKKVKEKRKYIWLLAYKHELAKDLGLALKILRNATAEHEPAATEARIKILRDMGYTQWSDYEMIWRVIKYPKKFDIH